MARLHSVHEASPLCLQPAHRGQDFSPEPGSVSTELERCGVGGGGKWGGECRGLLDPCDLAKVICSPENQDGTGGKWAGLLDSFKPEIHPTNQSSLHTSTAHPEQGLCVIHLSQKALGHPFTVLCPNTGTPNRASQPKGNGTNGIGHSNCRACEGTAAHFAFVTDPLK